MCFVARMTVAFGQSVAFGQYGYIAVPYKTHQASDSSFRTRLELSSFPEFCFASLSQVLALHLQPFSFDERTTLDTWLKSVNATQRLPLDIQGLSGSALGC